MKFDVTEYPGAVSLFGAVGVIVVAQHLTGLVHQFHFRVGFKLGLALGFHHISYRIKKHGKCTINFSMFLPQYFNRQKIFHL